ncbi:16457_t:CDS:1, partial [Dentiscutata heterogama]
MAKENMNEIFSTDLNLNDQNKSSFYSEDDIPTELELPKLPYPPEIKASELVRDLLLKYESKSPKMLNEFFIYRKAFVQAFKKEKLRPKMTHVSSLASASWHKESSDVKNEYRKIAREAEQLYINERKKRQQSQTTGKRQTSDSEITSTSTSPESTYDPVSGPSHNMVVNVAPEPSFIDAKPDNSYLHISNQDKLTEFSNVSSVFNSSYGPTSYEDTPNYYPEFTEQIMYTQNQQPMMHHETSIPLTNINFGLPYQPIISYNSSNSGTRYPYSHVSTQPLNSRKVSDYIDN